MRGLAKASSAGSNSSTGRRRGGIRGVYALLVLLVASCLGTSQALAATGIGHAPLAPITGASTPAGSFGSNLEATMGIDESAGKGYIADYYVAGVVNVFDLATGAYLEQITSADLVGAPFGTKLNPTGAVAVDNSGGPADGQVYVASADPNDASRGRIFVFDASGTYLRTIDGSETPAGSFSSAPTGLAVDDSTGRLFVSDYGNSVVDRFSAGGAYLSQIALDPAEGAPAGLDLDSAGNLYLNRYYRAVEKYGPSGNFLAVVDNDGPVSVAVDRSNDHVYAGGNNHIAEYDSTGALVSRFANGESNFLSGLAVDSSTGRIYDGHYETFNVYAPAATVTIPEVSIDPVDVGGVDYFEATVEGEIDPDGAPSWYAFEYRGAGGGNWSMTSFQAGGEGSGPVPVSATLTGLQANTEYEVRLVGMSGGREATAATATVTFTTKEATPPALTIDPVSAITIDGARLSGTVNPNDISTTARFEYSEDGSNWISLPSEDVGSGTTPIPVDADLVDLEPNTHYVVRLVAENQATSSTSSEVGFDTLSIAPNAYTMGAAPRAETTARLHGYVNPRRSATKYHFEFGPDTTYGTLFPEVEISADQGQKSVSQTVTGLQPGATYHYRVIAESAAGTTVGDDIAFTTRTASETGPRDRGIELINNPEKGNQPARPGSGNDRAVLASVNAERVLWSTVGGAPGGSLGTGSVFMAQRTGQGWQSTNILPPRQDLVDNGESPYTPVASTPGFDRFLYSIQNGVNDATPPILAAANDDGSGQRVFGVVEPTGQTVYRANDDLSHVYSLTGTRFDPTHPADADQVYDFSFSPPQLVSVAPNGTAVDCGVFADFEKRGFGGGTYEWLASDPSAPARVFFESEGEAPCPIQKDNERHGKIYMRDLASQTTVLLSGPALPGGPQGEEGSYVRSTPEGSEALFTADSRLTSEDTNDVGDIYSYSDGAGRKCLTCVGRGGGVEERGAANYRLILASEDLDYIYFASPNVLVPGVGEQGGSNIYLYHGGQLRYVAPGELDHEKSELTTGGRVLFFSSDRQEITDDETGGYQQYYRYDAADGSVECVSCKAGVAPTGPAYVQVPPSAARGGFGMSTASGDSFVFTTYSALERRDVNLAADVYEWRNGQVRLVTDGVSEPAGNAGVNLIGQGRDNMNVLFTSGNNLTGFERDNLGQYYAARIGGGGRPPTPLPPCESGDCQGPLAPPPGFAEPGSGSLSGSGNERGEARAKKPKARKCAKGRKATRSKGKPKCVKAKQAKSNRGAK